MNSDFPTPGLKHLLRGAPRDTRTPTDSHTAHAHTHTPSADLGRRTDPLQCTHNREHNTYTLLHHHPLAPKHNHAHAHRQQPSQDPYTGAPLRTTSLLLPHPRPPEPGPGSVQGWLVVAAGPVSPRQMQVPVAAGSVVRVCARWCGRAVLSTCVLAVCLSMFLHRCVPLHQAPAGEAVLGRAGGPGVPLGGRVAGLLCLRSGGEHRGGGTLAERGAVYQTSGPRGWGVSVGPLFPFPQQPPKMGCRFKGKKAAPPAWPWRFYI